MLPPCNRTVHLPGALTLDPKFDAPYTVPVLISMCEAQLVASASPTKYTLTVAFGALTLGPGGLAVSGCAHTGAVALTAGQSVSWAC